ncbi:MAG TPA: hypothetical protein VF507_07605, partial [Pyrinomonadaceae bacterium]
TRTPPHGDVPPLINLILAKGASSVFTHTSFTHNSRFPLIKISTKYFLLALLASALFPAPEGQAKKRRTFVAGQRAVVVDERLAALREAPGLSSNLLQRLGRGRVVGISGARRTPDGLTFYRASITRRTGGWLQSEAVVSPARSGDDERLLRLIRASDNFDRVARARIFLDLFPRSPLRPNALMLLAEASEEAAEKLSREAARRLDEDEIKAVGAPAYSYYLNYSGLDRFRRNGVVFTFNAAAKQFHYDGAAWREILRRYPQSPEAAAARKRLEALASSTPARAQ